MLFGLLCGDAPFISATAQDSHFNLLTSSTEQYWDNVSHGGVDLESNMKDLLGRMLHMDPSSRPSVRDIICDDIFKNVINITRINTRSTRRNTRKNNFKIAI